MADVSKTLRGKLPKFIASTLVIIVVEVGVFLVVSMGERSNPQPSSFLSNFSAGLQLLLGNRSLRRPLSMYKVTPYLPEIKKQDCERLVSGQLLFEPTQIMRQGQPYMVFARLTRTPGVNIAEGLGGSDFIVVKETVSCKVSVSLDSQEPGAFGIEKVPDGRKDEQVLEPNSFSQWDWRVTPKRHGELHLLLYVTPMLYVDGIGEQLKQFAQPPKVITVSPDYLYESKAFVKDNWAMLSGLLTAIVIPLFLWFREGIVSWFQKRLSKGEPAHP